MAASGSFPQDGVRPLVFFISGHGFGHASRQVEIIHALHQRRPDLGIVIRSSVSPELLRRTMRAPYELLAGPCDSGIAQRTSVEHDHDATARDTVAFYETFDARVADEVRRLSGLDVACVVGDIPPLAFATAAELGVPSIAIANFTWDWIYDAEPGLQREKSWLLPLIRGAYAKATVALELPFSGGFEVFPRRQQLPLVARQPSVSRVETRAQLGIPQDRPAALLSFGGYGLPNLDLASVDCLDEWTLVTTDRVTPAAGGPRRGLIYVDERQFLDSRCRYEDLVAAVDAVITKPGFGIIAECIAAGTPMLYTSRGEFREYDVLVEGIRRYLTHGFIDHADLFGGRWLAALERLAAAPPSRDTIATDGARVAAAAIEGVRPLWSR